MTETLPQWIRRITNGASMRSIAHTSGLKQATLARQMSGQRVPAETVAAIGHAYGANVLEGLLAHGLLTPDDIESVREVVGLRECSDRELTDEILRRLDERGTDSLDEPHPSAPRLTVLSDDVPEGWEEMPHAADAERDGDDTGEDDSTV